MLSTEMKSKESWICLKVNYNWIQASIKYRHYLFHVQNTTSISHLSTKVTSRPVIRENRHMIKTVLINSLHPPSLVGCCCLVTQYVFSIYGWKTLHWFFVMFSIFVILYNYYFHYNVRRNVWCPFARMCFSYTAKVYSTAYL